jgi:hypothetical protein
MDPADALAAIQDHLAKVEDLADLVRDAGLRVGLSRGRLRLEGLAELVGDLDAAIKRLWRLLAHLPAKGGPNGRRRGKSPDRSGLRRGLAAGRPRKGKSP